MVQTPQWRICNMEKLEWCANWQMENRYYCSPFAKDASDKKVKGFSNPLENMFGSKYGGFRYDKRHNGYEVWFRNKDDMLTLKLLFRQKRLTWRIIMKWLKQIFGGNPEDDTQENVDAL